MLCSGNEHSVLRSIVPDVFAGFHGIGAESHIVGNAFAPDRQPGAEEGNKRREYCQEPPSAEALQAFPEAGYPIRDDHAAQQPRQVKQLVVVIFIGLEADEFRCQDNGQRHPENPAVPRFLFKQRCKQCQHRQADILDIEPEIQIPHAISARIVHPVELQLQEGMGILLEGLAKGKAEQLRRRQCQDDQAVNRVTEQDSPPGSALHERLRIPVDQVIAHGTQGRQSQGQEAVGMDQGQRSCPDAQQDQPPVPVFPVQQFRPEFRIQQIEAGHNHAPAAQRRPLGNQHIADHIAPSQVVGIRLVGGRFVITRQDQLNPFRSGGEPVGYRLSHPCQEGSVLIQHRPGAAAGLVKVIQEAQSAVQEEQRRCQQCGLLAAGHIPCQHQHAHIAQSHHQRSGNDHRSLQAASQQIEGGAQAVCQEGIAQPRSGEERIVRWELLPDQSGDKTQVHRQIPVGALPHIPVSVRVHTHHMAVLQPDAQDGQRNTDNQQLPEQLAFLFIPFRRCALVPQEPAQNGQEKQDARGKSMRFHLKPEQESAQGGQPHFLQQAQAHSQPQPVQRAVPGQQEADRHHTEKQVHQAVCQ